MNNWVVVKYIYYLIELALFDYQKNYKIKLSLFDI